MKKLKIIFGTGNQAKLGAMQRRLASLPLEVVGLNEVRGRVSDDVWEKLRHIEENGKSPLENAVVKARAYYEAFGCAVFSCDSGLYFDNVPEEVQPGVHVRTIDGKYCTDLEMTEYYTGLARKYGDLRARYRNAICLILEDGREFASMDESMDSQPFLLTAVPHEKFCVPGFPLDRISKDLHSGKYFYDLEPGDVDQLAMEDGVLAFFKDVLEQL